MWYSFSLLSQNCSSCNNFHFSLDFLKLLVASPHPNQFCLKIRNPLFLPQVLSFWCGESISFINTIFLCLLCHLFLYWIVFHFIFSGLFPFDSFKNLFLPTESLQFSGMRFCLLFLSQHVMFIMRLTSLFFGSKVSWTFSLRHFYFPSHLCGSVLWKFFIACSPLSFSFPVFLHQLLGRFYSSVFLHDDIRNLCYEVWSKNYKSSALFRSLHMFISKWIVLEEVLFLYEACPELHLFKKKYFNLKESISQNKIQFCKNLLVFKCSSGLGNPREILFWVITEYWVILSFD